MISILVLIGFIAIIGMVVAYVTTLPMNPMFKNLIYLVVGVVIVLMLIHGVQSGHIPEFK